MDQAYIIEIKIVDFVDKQLLNPPDQYYDINILDLFEKHLEDCLGGMLCLEHFHIPEISIVESKYNAYVFDITCCCIIQSTEARRRIQQMLK